MRLELNRVGLLVPAGMEWLLFIHTVAQGIDNPGHGSKYTSSPAAYLRSTTDTVDASIRTLF